MQVLDDLTLRLYRRNLVEAERECQEGFPYVRMVCSSLAWLFLEFADTVSPSQLQAFVRGQVMSLQPRGAEFAGDVVSEEEASVTRRFIAYQRQDITLNGQPFSSIRVSRRERALRGQEARGEVSLQLDNKPLRKELTAALDPILPNRQTAGGALRYWSPAGNWHILTDLDLATKSQLAFNQQIRTKPNLTADSELIWDFSPLAWFGVHHTTRFNLIQADGVTAGTSGIRSICQYFQQQMFEVLGEGR